MRGMEKRCRWECLPGELLAYIFGKLHDDFQYISAPRAVCKHWRESSLLLTSFTVRFYLFSPPIPTKLITSMASFISKAACLEKLDVGDMNSEANRLLESCDWTNLSHSLRTFSASFGMSGISQSVCSLLSGCQSLSEVYISSDFLATDLSFQFVSRLRILHLQVPGVVADLLNNLSHLPCMEELFLIIYSMEKYTVTLTAPKLRRLHVILPSGDLVVEAPLVTRVEVSGKHARVHFSAACQLEAITLGPGTVLARGPGQLKKLAIVSSISIVEEYYNNDRFVESLPSCQAVPHFLCEKKSIADSFLTKIGRLVRLKELEINLCTVNLLQGLGPLKDFFSRIEDSGVGHVQSSRTVL